MMLSWLWGRDPAPQPAAGITPAAADPALSGVQATSAANSKPSVLGHFAFAEAAKSELQAVGSYGERQILLRKPAAQSYLQMVSAARQAGISIVPISGFRSIQDQEYLFFKRAQAQALRPEERALVSAPPGYSEHHTGYAIDIADGSSSQTVLQISFDQTPAFRWMQAHAARYGFELSFPQENPQGVSYEPWHWRYVGDRASLETFYSNQPLPSSAQDTPSS
jgi:D-alanyl-D-alanine carboxypeptidase